MTSILVPVLVGLAVCCGGRAARELSGVPGWRRARLRLDLHRAALPPPAAVVRAHASAAIPWPVDRCWLAWQASLVTGAVAGVMVGGPVLAVPVAVVLGAGPALGLALMGGRADRLADAALPGSLDAIARSLRTGATLRQALGEAAAAAPEPLRAELTATHAAAVGGVPFTVALDAWEARRPRAAVSLAVAALALAAEAGGAAARSVDGVAATLRANLAVAAEARALSSQARYAALVIAMAPAAFGLLAAGADGRTAAFLLQTPVGLACLAAGLTLDALGAWWMHRITTGPAG